MNNLVVCKIETAILENTGIIKLYGDSEYVSHASVSDNTGIITDTKWLSTVRKPVLQLPIFPYALRIINT